jgi:hypothetical protein
MIKYGGPQVDPRTKKPPSMTMADCENYPNKGEFLGAGEGIRTLDPDLGKVVLYP